MIKRANHPSGLTVSFSEKDHRYVVEQTGQILTSVTTYIGTFFPKFDTDAVAKKCVGKPKYGNMTESEIKMAWEAEAERGRREGTNTHFYAEEFLYGRHLPRAESLREQQLFDQVAVAILALEERFVFVASESIVFSEALGIGGTIDLLMFDPKKRDLIIFDWKQNKKLSHSNPWQKALPPLANWEDTDINKYSLQLNLYEKIIVRENYLGFESIPKAKGIRKGLIHLKEDGCRFIKIGDNQKEVEAILEEVPF